MAVWIVSTLSVVAIAFLLWALVEISSEFASQYTARLVFRLRSADVPEVVAGSQVAREVDTSTQSERVLRVSGRRM